ncbi:transcriptional regulator [candidate division WWE3 bacterium CG_4_9_14_0_2_um_filter_35_11]|uniref:Transcriptional regulator n=1 Tax=candidate division WWE3 bacterium CG_4_9_14_0_2_um_filter_35_11 TaxID=1975077 RepID=A0A2M8EMM6_UNCKA|nr:MAG: transcriptional regulator [candidate division WWE3 bacterium CG10_big_fil_rev_8_21_14_0_10_35_32]PJC23971.1 MAG: transcriptional regulator [candidate division WWE3 bacterium CG_4_9_14_0_2_um_filter_35_11]
MISSRRLKKDLSETENKKLKEEYGKAFSKRLKEIRLQKGLTQEGLSELASLHLTYVGHLELGRYHPSLFTVWKLAKALGVSMSKLTDL